MVSRNSNSLPTIELDLTATEIYNNRGHNVNVFRLQKLTRYPAYHQMLEKVGPFNVDTVKVDKEHKVQIHKKNVSMVNVYLDESNKVILFETYYDEEEIRGRRPEKQLHRYHARDIEKTSGEGSSENKGVCWREYMYKDNDTLDIDNLDKVLDDLKKGQTPLNKIKGSGSDATLNEEEVFEETDLEAQIDQRTQGGKVKEFFISRNGMVTAVATGSVGGAAIGGTIIYMVAS
ncbi:hypothetical protein MACJ_001605 [Theileria orientalis]|uniref:Uncharacterized protein n=1 Tax=Theileria orientalis TaxID=68886 RepID=A0A976M8W5_THEOR|nr:hypothetical protein MACJ_001605 [Theileria orientalis]